MSTYGTSRPVAAPPKSYSRPAPKRDSQWLSDLTENLKEPKAMGIIGAIAVVALLACWQFLPKSRGADIAKYKQMKELLAEIKSKRTSAPSELSALQTKLSKMGKDITLELKDKASRDDPAKQCLLWAARDEIPRMVTQGLTAEGTAEKCFEGRLQEAAYELRLEKRPPVDPALQLARTQED
jgi:hypothetical protein